APVATDLRAGPAAHGRLTARAARGGATSRRRRPQAREAHEAGVGVDEHRDLVAEVLGARHELVGAPRVHGVEPSGVDRRAHARRRAAPPRRPARGGPRARAAGPPRPRPARGARGARPRAAAGGRPRAAPPAPPAAARRARAPPPRPPASQRSRLALCLWVRT